MRLRFTIRDMIFIPAIVVLAVGWWLDHRRAAIDAAIEKDNQIYRIREKILSYEVARSVDGPSASIDERIKWLEKQIKDREAELGR